MGLTVERAGEQPSLPVGEQSQPAEDRADLLAPEDDRDGVGERVGVLSDRIDQPAFGVLDWCGGWSIERTLVSVLRWSARAAFSSLATVLRTHALA